MKVSAVSLQSLNFKWAIVASDSDNFHKLYKDLKGQSNRGLMILCDSTVEWKR